MLRDRNLVPLSHQHQHALALCVRIERAIQAGPVDLAAWQEEIRNIFDLEIRIHFQAEEELLFPAAREFPELHALVGDLLAEHQVLRRYFGSAAESNLDSQSLLELARKLSAHIRKEERQLFEGIQERMTRERLEALGTQLQKALETATQACTLPAPGTRLKGTK